VSQRRPIEHHHSVEYRVHDHGVQGAGFSVTASTDGRTVDVTGVCPGCGGLTATTWSYGTGNGYKGVLRRQAARESAPSGPRTVCCECGHAHANRPEEAIFLGCGAHWQVDLP
jgi:hypothetical protein